MQTALQWLQEQYTDRFHISEEMKEIFIQARQMEEEQIMEAYDIGHEANDEETSENYYRQKYTR